jgi:predicted alpha/beta-fold hydrolase
LFLAGFSLGGNFALRVAVRSHDAGIRLDRVAAVCPVLHPPSTMAALENGLQIYHLYFMKKWRDSLRIKKRYFPHLKGLEKTSAFKTISEMTAYFVEHFTEFPDLMTYLKGYAITGETLAGLPVEATLITSMDDPIIPVGDLKNLATPAQLAIETKRYGGHCGFLEDFHLKSWADRRLADIFLGS